MGPMVGEKAFVKGGHFAAWERPEDLAGQLCGLFEREVVWRV
jgi:hypothetical protein